MEVLTIILLVILGLLLINIIAYFVVIHIVFKSMFLRLDKEVLLNTIDLSKTHYKDFMDITINNMEKFMSLPYEEVSIKSLDGLTLYGRYYNNHSDKTLLFYHGYHASPFNNINTPGLIFLDKGYNILLITMRSHEKSEGRYITFGVKEKEDAYLWYQFLLEKYNPKNIILYGVSMGASTLAMISDRVNKNVDAIILDSAYTGAYEEVLFSIKRKLNLLPRLVTFGLSKLCLKKGQFELEKGKAKEALSKCNVPVFFIHGDKDIIVPLQMAKENYDACKSKKYLYIADANHAVSIYQNSVDITKKFEEFMAK